VTGLVIGTQPGGILEFCARMEKMHRLLVENASIKAFQVCTSAITKQVAQMNRAQQFLVEQYQKSPLAKKRKAKAALTAALNFALARARKTLREIAQLETCAKKIVELIISLASPPSLSNFLAANAPNLGPKHREYAAALGLRL